MNRVYSLVHEHKHGASVFPFRTDLSPSQLPSVEALGKTLDVDFEPEKE